MRWPWSALLRPVVWTVRYACGRCRRSRSWSLARSRRISVRSVSSATTCSYPVRSRDRFACGAAVRRNHCED
uniref:Putative secreted protein n=1 Tax=Anopheles darlingi TaxID=43151 RepID=A0A2M4DQ13_ANODA